MPRRARTIVPVSSLGKFVKLETIGRGGMGEVCKAFDTELDRWVALKFLIGSDPEDVARFKREAQTAARLSHPNIAAVYEVGDAADRPFIAMQLIAGPTLSSLPRTDRRALAALVRDAALAVHHAHERGVVHRDLKPANLMVENGRVFVMDFGLARRTGARTSLSGAVVGTPAYMSPEQARGEATDARSDVYSLGATLYELLAGRPPFEGPQVYEVLLRVIGVEPRPPGGDADLDTVVLKCLEKEPGRRYATAQALAEDLTRWLDREPILAHPPSLFYRLRKRLAKRKLPVALGIVLAVLFASYFGFIRPQWAAAAEQKRIDDEVFAPLRARLPELTRTPDGTRRAIALFEAALARHPQFWDGWMKKGELCEQVAGFDEALAAYAKAAALNPRLGAAHYRRGRIYMDERNAFDDARRAFEAAPGDDEYALLGRARVAAITGDSARALALCDRAEALAPHLAEPHLVRGYLFSPTEPARAIECLTRAIALDPRHGMAYYNRGIVRSRLGDLKGALADHTAALAIRPGSEAFTARGAVKHSLGDVDGALADFEAAIKGNPKAKNAYCNRSGIRLIRRDFAGAIEDASRAIEIDPGFAEAYVNRGMARHDSAAAGARSDFDEAIRLDPKYAGAWHARGVLRLAGSDGEGALADLNRALELRPAHASSLYYRGRVHILLAHPDECLHDLSESIRLDPQPDAYYARAYAHMVMRSYAAAVADGEEALRRAPAGYPDRERIERLLADARRAKGE